MTMEDIKKQIKDNVKFESVNPPQTGGQTCGVIYSKQRLYSEELDLTIETGYFRQNYKNRELLLSIFDTALNHIIR